MKNVGRGLFLLFLVAILLTVLVASAQDTPLNAPVPILVPEVIAEYPHDPNAFTQGLLLHNGTLYESTGAGNSGNFSTSLRQVDLDTGEVTQIVERGTEVFGEGLALVGDRLIQLTWQDHVAFVYELDTFDEIAQFDYEGEGWGLCYDGEYLFMSDGSPYITLRDVQTFELIFDGAVTYQGTSVGLLTFQNRSIGQLNELECVGDYVYANVYLTNLIYKIDKRNGRVVNVIDAAGLLSEEDLTNDPPPGVLNGIAYKPDTDTFLITGKNWPKIFEVHFVERDPSTGEGE